jgi:arylsulfatase A-like enzyme/Tfp pilus assembly protein PilF
MKVLLAILAILISAPLFAAPRHVPSRPNIVLVTIDTVRADHVGCYGGKAVSTPILDSLARDGIVFERAIAQVPLTYPSHTVIMTGLYPFQNGAQEFTSLPLAPKYRTIAQALQEHGYSTGAVVSSFALDHSWGLARGFDFYDDAFSPENRQGQNPGSAERRAENSVTHALAWLQRTPKRPFFLWLHLYDPHSPYNPPEPFRTRFASHLYDGEIAYADQQLGRLIRWLKLARVYDSSLVIVMSDHGESLGDHGEKEHGFFIYNATVHVPLILKPPLRSDITPGRNPQTVETTSIPSTMVRFAGFNDPIESHSAPLPLFDHSHSQTTAYSETFYPFASFGWSPLHSIESGRFHFIDAPSAELYDVIADPDEIHNLVATQSATVAVLKQQLQDILRTNSTEPAETKNSTFAPEAQEKLRALGYVAYRSPVPEGMLLHDLPDPKTKLPEFNAIFDAEAAARAGDFDRARERLSAIKEKDPNLYIVPFYLGEYALAQNQWAEAVTEFEECLRLSPDFRQAMTGLARALAFQGKSQEAAQWARKVVTVDPQSYQAWYVLAFVESRQNPQAAIEYYGKAIAIEPSFAPLHRDLGTLELQNQNFAQAAQHLKKAVDLGSDDEATLNSLGIAYSRTNRLREAIDAYTKALARNPNVAEVHVNLATVYRRLQNHKGAKTEFEAACKLAFRYCQ